MRKNVSPGDMFREPLVFCHYFPKYMFTISITVSVILAATSALKPCVGHIIAYTGRKNNVFAICCVA